MRNEIETRLRADALADPAFREALLADTAVAIAERYGVSAPTGVTIRAIAEAPDAIGVSGSHWKTSATGGVLVPLPWAPVARAVTAPYIRPLE